MKKIPFSALKLLNVLFVTCPFAAVWSLFYGPFSIAAQSVRVTLLLMLLYFFCFYYFAGKLDGFRASIKHLGDLVFGQIIAVFATNFFASVMMWMLLDSFPNLLPLLVCIAVQIIVIILCCLGAQYLFFASYPPKKAVIVYDLRQGIESLISAYGLEKRYDVLGIYSIEEVVRGETKEEQDTLLDKMLGDASEVFLSGIQAKERNILLKYCFYRNKRVLAIPRVSDMMMSASERLHMFHLPILRSGRYYPPLEFRIAKRAMDIILSGISLLLLSPVFILVTLLVRSDGGPALYKQVRLTKDGKQFKILKFRSMCVDAEKYTGAVLSAGEDDPRITRVGRFIRACRMDEIPQLWNIFVGDMSIVGPRPERPEIAAKIEQELPEFALRLQCKAGLTGYAQVYGKYNTEPYDKLLMDLMYISHPSLLEDLSIILATIKILFSKESTEGVNENNTVMKYQKRVKN